MKYNTIEEIYRGNKKIRERLKALISPLTETQASSLPEGEKWTVSQIVEHVSMVDEGAMRICARLLKKAKDGGQLSDGKVVISENFLQKAVEIATMKVDAPGLVQPTSGITISDSLKKLDENTNQLEELRAMFESVDGTALKFPPDEKTLVSYNPIVALTWTADDLLYFQTAYIKRMKNEGDNVTSFPRWHRLVLTPQAASR